MKIRLNEKTFTIKDGAALSSIYVPCNDFTEVEAVALELFENIKIMEILDDEDKVSAHYEDLALLNNVVCETIIDKQLYVYFGLREKTDIEKRVEALEESQKIQDYAISDLGDVVSELAED